ncbi:hypothetical protein EDC96DRAFT_570297 [Choanephora cucurbitarum]|nr:hypothetical protein EDC96DRAFT_570297 [Choanephora cucurbitarum]
MRNLQSLGLHSAGFSRLLSARLYAAFIRPKSEYGLSVSWFLKRQLRLLDKAQDQCLRLAFGDHRASSTVVFRHMCNLPSMTERVHILVFKMLYRLHHKVPDDSLVRLLFPSLLSPSHRLAKLGVQNPLLEVSFGVSIGVSVGVSGGVSGSVSVGVSAVVSDSAPVGVVTLGAGGVAVPMGGVAVSFLGSGGHGGADGDCALIESDLPKMIKKFRQDGLNKLLSPVPPLSAPVLLSVCRPLIMLDPVIRTHLLLCQDAAGRLQFAGDPRPPSRAGSIDRRYKPNPLDYWLNRLPRVKPAGDSARAKAVAYWSTLWPALLSLLLQIDQICHPDADFVGDSLVTSGSLLLDWLAPSSSSAVATVVSSVPASSSQELIADLVASIQYD